MNGSKSVLISSTTEGMINHHMLRGLPDKEKEEKDLINKLEASNKSVEDWIYIFQAFDDANFNRVAFGEKFRGLENIQEDRQL
jgi:hypothetical protein